MTDAPQFGLGSRVRPSPFYEATLRWGARAFTTYNHTLMPASYGDPLREYRALTEAVTLWDVAAERQTQISGRDAFKFAQYLTPRELQSCAPGRCRYALLTNAHGGVINDPVLLRLEESLFWLSAADSDLLLWCRGVAAGGGFDVDLRQPDVSPLQLQGPRAPEVAAKLFGEWARELKYFRLRRFEFEGAPLVLSRTGWSGEAGYEIYLCDGEKGEWLWEKIMSAGEEFGIAPAAPSPARRLEAGLLSYGADVNDNDTPFHLGLERLVDLDGDFDFIGKSALLELRERGVDRKLCGVEISGGPMQTPLVRWQDVFASGGSAAGGGERVGKLRSAAYSPGLDANIGLAMLAAEHCAPGTKLQTQHAKLTVRPLPFLQTRAP